jgi:hypothetical protein
MAPIPISAIGTLISIQARQRREQEEEEEKQRNIEREINKQREYIKHKIRKYKYKMETYSGSSSDETYKRYKSNKAYWSCKYNKM